MANVYAASIGILLASTFGAAPAAFAADPSDSEVTITAEGDAAKTLDRSFPLASSGTIDVRNV